MVHVQSTWFPIIDRNPQRFVQNIFLARTQIFNRHAAGLPFGPACLTQALPASGAALEGQLNSFARDAAIKSK